MGNKVNTYSTEFKLIARTLGIPHRKQVERWVKVYRTRGPEGLKEQQDKARGPNKGRPKKLGIEEELLKLKVENEYLKKLLTLEGWDVPKNPNLK